jgi:hypothetical protein
MNIQGIIERIKKEEVIEEGTVKQLCKKIQELFMTESNVEQVSSPINLVGDVHGQFYDVLKLLKIGTFPSNQPETLLIPGSSSSVTSSTGATTLLRPSCSSSA